MLIFLILHTLLFEQSIVDYTNKLYYLIRQSLALILSIKSLFMMYANFVLSIRLQ